MTADTAYVWRPNVAGRCCDSRRRRAKSSSWPRTGRTLAGGGSWFGDSGGPCFHNGLLVGDTSFGASQFSRSGGGYHRLDTDDVWSFLEHRRHRH